MIVVFSGRDMHNFMSNAKITVIDVSIDKHYALPLIARLEAAQQMFFYDTYGAMEYLLQNILETHNGHINRTLALTLESNIVNEMSLLIENQEAESSKLTKGEVIAFDIRDKVFKHMDGKLNTQMLAQQHKVTTQTLQNSFKSLFGYTPQLFLRLLKLNLVHHELYEANERDTTVLRVGQTWGFDHMGRLAGFYKELFGEIPSATLKEENQKDDGMRLGCVERQEEIIV